MDANWRVHTATKWQRPRKKRGDNSGESLEKGDCGDNDDNKNSRDARAENDTHTKVQMRKKRQTNAEKKNENKQNESHPTYILMILFHISVSAALHQNRVIVKRNAANLFIKRFRAFFFLFLYSQGKYN